ncbi:MAG: tetratricopeptide repeat protein [Calditrichaeota bacterium]|nr:tetratricopeptide repeat protein [Calditrichota bacterium]
MIDTVYKKLIRFVFSPWFVALLAIAVRVIYLIQYSDSPFFKVPLWDAEDYFDIAASFSQARIDPSLIFRPPLYPLLLGMLYLFFGVDQLLPRLFGIVIGAWSCVLVMRISGRLYGKYAGTAAGIIAALCGLMIYFDLEILPTTLFILCILAFLLEMMKLDSSEGSPYRAGLYFALAALTRPVILTFLPVALLWLYFREKNIRTALRFLGVSLLPLALMLLLHLAMGKGAVLISAQGGVNYYIGNHHQSDGMTAKFPGIGTGWGWLEMKRWAELKTGEELSDADVDRLYWKEGRQEIVSHPKAWLKLMLRKSLLFWNKVEISSNRDLYHHGRQFPLIGMLMFIGFANLLPLAFAGMLLGWKKNGVKLLLLFMSVFYLTIIQFFVNGRFRHPLTPLLIILAVGGVVGIVRLIKARTDVCPIRWVSLGIVVIIGVALPRLTATGFDAASGAYGLFTEGKAYERLGDFDKAEQLYNESIEADSRAPHVNFYIAELARQRGDINRAVEYYRRELEIQPDHAKAWNNLGVSWSDLDEDANALFCFERALELRPQLSEAGNNICRIWGLRGIQFSEEGRWQDAYDCFRKALEYDHGELFFKTLSLDAVYNMGDQQRAIFELDSLLEVHPGFAPAMELKIKWMQVK